MKNNYDVQSTQTKNLIAKEDRMNKTYLIFLALISCNLFAQNIPTHAEGLNEELISVQLREGVRQEGVLSLKKGFNQPSKLAVILPGYPSVVRPVVENKAMVSSKLNGNFLIRARRFLVDESLATLVADCHSDSGDYCSSTYQASPQRHQDIAALILEVKKKLPSIQEVWLVGTSMGTISSSFMPLHQSGFYAGTIHTASITEPHARNSYRELSNFDYKKITIPQVFIHHQQDPCHLTTYSGAKAISEKYQVPLVTVKGGEGFYGPACNANTEHGFKGKEREVMKLMNEFIRTGKLSQLEVN